MPTYEYTCTQCGGHFEYFQSMTEAAKSECETCGGKLSRLVGAGGGLMFKGSGFYITDYKSTGAGSSSAGSSEGSSAGAGKSSDAGSSGSTAAPAAAAPAAAPATSTGGSGSGSGA